MDKQQAIDFILERIAHDYTQEEIVRDLSHHLKAPQDVLKTLVAKIEAQHPHIRPQAQPEPPAEMPAYETAAPAAPAAEVPADLPSAFLSNFDESTALPEPEPAPVPQAELANTRTAALPSPETGTIASAKAARQAKLLENNELTQAVLSMLKKGRKRSEITMFVCERTGIEWSQAQRFVAQVEVDKYKSISAHKNTGIIIFGILFALAGLAVLLFGLFSLAPYLMILFNTEIDIPVYISMRPDAVIGILVTGFGLLVGGIVGTILAIQGQSKA